jgi:hypothetical protein
MMGSLTCGAGLILLPRFSASGFLDSARRHGATEFNAIGAMLEILMRQPPRPDDADTALRLCYTGPAPARERQEEMERRFGLRIGRLVSLRRRASPAVRGEEIVLLCPAVGQKWFELFLDGGDHLVFVHNCSFPRG